MSSIYRIRENMPEYTETEMKIAKYILEHKNFVISSSAQKVSEAIGTSSAALVRFSKTLGYSGFTELKVELAKSSEEVTDNYAALINDSDDLEVLVNKVKYRNNSTFENTYKLLNLQDLETSVNMFESADKIHLFGIGASGIVCDDLFQKLVRIDREVSYHRDIHLGISGMSHAKENDLVVGISYSGETQEIISALAIAKEQGLNTISITQLGKTSIDKYSDISFKVPKEESEYRLGSISSRFSMLAITDLLYLGIAHNDIELLKNNIIKTKLHLKKFSEKY